MRFDIAPATPGLWPRLRRVYEAREKSPDSCWCQRLRRHDAPDNRMALRQEIEQSEAPVGLQALADGEVAGWTRVVPRASLPGIVENRALARLLDDAADAWWVSCFVVRREHRGQGLGVTLLRGAAEWTFAHGASLVDGHPVDVDALRGSPAPSAVFTGTASMFLRAGFTEIGRTYPSRPVMRRLSFNDSTIAETDS